MFTDKNLASISFGLMIILGISALVTKGAMVFFLAPMAGIQGYFFVRCAMGCIEAKQATNAKAFDAPVAADTQNE
jgi:hypothetical protein